MKTAPITLTVCLGFLIAAGALADDLLLPGDRALAIGRRVVSNSSYPGGEAPPNILDGSAATKYLNFAGAHTGFIVTLSGGAATVRSMEIATGGDAEERDPTSFVIYGSNDAITSADNSDGLGENWTEIASGALALPGARQAFGPPVDIVNATAYTSYKVVFPTLKGTTQMQVSEVELYDAAGGIAGGGNRVTVSSDAILAIQDPVPATSYNPGESPAQAIDGIASSKYFNFGKEDTGLIVVPAYGLTRVASFVITTANDFEDRDPASYELYGTLDLVTSEDNSTGEEENWVSIASGPLSLPVARDAAGLTVVVDADMDYLAYKILFPTLKGPTGVPDGMQIADVQFDGTIVNPPEGDPIITQGDRIIAVDPDLGVQSAYNPAEAPIGAVDDFSDTKYLNLGGVNSGFIITPGSGSSTNRSFQITTADDEPGRDPAAWELYGTDDPITSADNSAGTNENWTLIDSGTVTLPDTRETLGPVVPVSNTTAYLSYRMYFTELKDDAQAMQIAEIQFYEDAAGLGTPILTFTDPILAVQAPVSESAYAGFEAPWLAIDGDPNDKYQNQGGENSGFILRPFAPSTIVQQFVITTANNAEHRDPATWELYGTLDPLMSVDNSTGESENWTLIDSGSLSLPPGRGVVSSPVLVVNSNAYRTYKMLFPDLKDPLVDDILQFAEIQFRGAVLDPGPTPLLAGSDPILAINPRQQALSSYPGPESPVQALDGNSATKYLNFGALSSGFIVTPGSSTVQSFVITTANDAAERDPSGYAFYGTTDAITSPDNSAGTNENWTLIKAGSVNLPPARQAVGPVVPMANATAYTSYKMVFITLKDNNAPSMQIADIQFYDNPAGTGTGLLAASDPILAIGERVESVSDYPAGESPARLMDGFITTKYLNFGQEQSGFIVTPVAGPSVLSSFVLKTANDAPERDPSSYELYGTLDPITSLDNGPGISETWTLIASGTLSMPGNRLQIADIVSVSNTATYTSYKMLFPTLKAPAPSMQLAEAQFFGEVPGAAYSIVGFSRVSTNLTLQWESQAGAGYEIFYTQDLTDWSLKLPGTITGTVTTTEHTFPHPVPGAGGLSFRVSRP